MLFIEEYNRLELALINYQSSLGSSQQQVTVFQERILIHASRLLFIEQVKGALCLPSKQASSWQFIAIVDSSRVIVEIKSLYDGFQRRFKSDTGRFGTVLFLQSLTTNHIEGSYNQGLSSIIQAYSCCIQQKSVLLVPTYIKALKTNNPYHYIDLYTSISLFEKATPVLRLELFW